VTIWRPPQYLLHVLRERLNYPERKSPCSSCRPAWAAGVVLIEDRASGTPAAPRLNQISLSSGAVTVDEKVFTLLH